MPESAADVFATSILTIGCIYLGVMAFFIAMWWNIFTKAGYDGARAFLLLIPVVNLIIMIMFAFGEWPMRRELEALRMQAMMQRNQGPVVQQISLSAGGAQVYPQPPAYPPQQPYPQPYGQPPYQPPQYPQM